MQRIRVASARRWLILSDRVEGVLPWRRPADWDRMSEGETSDVVRLSHGARLKLPPSDPLSRIIADGRYERAERRFVSSFLREGDVVVDVGANIGLYTVIAGHRVGPRGRVYALEPTPATFQLLRANARLNGFTWVECVNVGLSDRAEIRDIYGANGDVLGVYNSLARPILDAPVSAGEQVALTTLDEFVHVRGLIGRIAFMKVDVEGWEERVLMGADGTLSRPDAPVLQVEFTEAAAASAGTCCASLYAALRSLGFTLFRIDPRSGFLVVEPPGRAYPYVNLIAAKLPRRPEPFFSTLGVSPLQLRRHLRPHPSPRS